MTWHAEGVQTSRTNSGGVVNFADAHFVGPIFPYFDLIPLFHLMSYNLYRMPKMLEHDHQTITYNNCQTIIKQSHFTSFLCLHGPTDLVFCSLLAIGFLWRSAKKTTSDSQERSNVWSFTRAAVALVAALVDDLVAALVMIPHWHYLLGGPEVNICG